MNVGNKDLVLVEPLTDLNPLGTSMEFPGNLITEGKVTTVPDLKDKTPIGSFQKFFRTLDDGGTKWKGAEGEFQAPEPPDVFVMQAKGWSGIRIQHGLELRNPTPSDGSAMTRKRKPLADLEVVQKQKEEKEEREDSSSRRRMIEARGIVSSTTKRSTEKPSNAISEAKLVEFLDLTLPSEITNGGSSSKGGRVETPKHSSPIAAALIRILSLNEATTATSFRATMTVFYEETTARLEEATTFFSELTAFIEATTAAIEATTAASPSQDARTVKVEIEGKWRRSFVNLRSMLKKDLQRWFIGQQCLHQEQNPTYAEGTGSVANKGERRCNCKGVKEVAIAHRCRSF